MEGVWLTDAEIRERIEAIGVEELGRRYAVRLIASLNDMRSAEDARAIGVVHDDDEWVDLAGFDGEQLSDE